jgi:hypothetical protein
MKARRRAEPAAGLQICPNRIATSRAPRGRPGAGGGIVQGRSRAPYCEAGVLFRFALHRRLKPLAGKSFSDYRLAGFDSRQPARLMIRACVWSAAHPIKPSPVNPTLPTILRQTPSPKRAQPRRATGVPPRLPEHRCDHRVGERGCWPLPASVSLTDRLPARAATDDETGSIFRHINKLAYIILSILAYLRMTGPRCRWSEK